MITAPFNFVPVSEQVFFPDWTEKVSHDIPFEDGESGVIDITITAKSPLFIRDTNDETTFCNHEGTHYIPSTSLKGMVRSVLEIMSFSKMKEVDDNTYSIKNGLPHAHHDMRKDLAETIFGYVEKDKALKGRVHFSHAKITNKAIVSSKVSEILGTPKASYYPIYIVQNGKKYKDFKNNNFRLSGWKRYPVHKSKPKATHDTGNDTVKTTFQPLKEGVVFKSKLRYHNLKRVEIGALLSALSFHNNAKCFHNIGLAKPLGYGKIKVDVAHENINVYLKEFELLMHTQIDTWAKSPQLKELFTMASEQDNRQNSVLAYMELKQFASAKKKKEYLKYYSQLDGIKQNIPQTLLAEKEDIDKPEEIIISKTKMRKVISAYFQKKYDIRYHPKQIEEFFANENFIITPKEQSERYLKHKNDKNFIPLLTMIHSYNKGSLPKNTERILFKALSKS